MRLLFRLPQNLRTNMLALSVDVLAMVTLRNLSSCCPPDLKLKTAVDPGRRAPLPQVATARSEKGTCSC